jgi:hypothetical protein
MATYIELHGLRGAAGADQLQQKIAVAICIKANAIAKLPIPTATQKSWATAALSNPESYVGLILNYILADYNAATVSAITGASDASVQTAVNAAVDTLLGV